MEHLNQLLATIGQIVEDQSVNNVATKVVELEQQYLTCLMEAAGQKIWSHGKQMILAANKTEAMRVGNVGRTFFADYFSDLPSLAQLRAAKPYFGAACEFSQINGTWKCEAVWTEGKGILSESEAVAVAKQIEEKLCQTNPCR